VYARVSILEGSRERVDEGLRYLREEVLSAWQADPGFKGVIAHSDRQKTCALWRKRLTVCAAQVSGD
jgi:hypothetical protein